MMEVWTRPGNDIVLEGGLSMRFRDLLPTGMLYIAVSDVVTRDRL
jgi:hypothetical protein